MTQGSIANADLTDRSGAGVDLCTQRPKPAAVAKAVRRVLADPSIRERSQALALGIAASGGAAELAASVREPTGTAALSTAAR